MRLRLAPVLLSSIGTVIACSGQAQHFVKLPDGADGERTAIVVVEDERGLSGVAFDLEQGEPIIRTSTDESAIVHIFYYAGEIAEAGELAVADEDACRSLGLAGFSRLYRSVVEEGTGLVEVAELPPHLSEVRFEARCPCVRFVATEVPMLDATVYDAAPIDDDRVLVVTRAGVEEISVSRMTASLALDAPSRLRSMHVTEDGRRWFGDVDGSLLLELPPGHLEVVATASDTTALRYLAGRTDEPLELLTLHDSGFVRRWDGTRFTELLDDRFVGMSEHQGSLVSVARGHAVIVQSSGSGIHVWDATATPPLFHNDWDIVFAGPIKRIEHVEGYDLRLTTRTSNVYTSRDGRAWTRVVNDASTLFSSVVAFGLYDGLLVEARDRGGLQILPPDGRYCPAQELETQQLTDQVFQLGDKLVLIGDVPDGSQPVAVILEREAIP